MKRWYQLRLWYQGILQSLGKVQIPWKIDSIVKVAIVGLVVILVSSLVFKPRVDSESHADYLANLNRMDALASELHRDHLLASKGQGSHYDYLESDLEQMERSADLALIAPRFVNSKYNTQLTQLVSAYRSDVSKVRKAGRNQSTKYWFTNECSAGVTAISR